MEYIKIFEVLLLLLFIRQVSKVGRAMDYMVDHSETSR